MKVETLPICEQFTSFQGEGFLVGTPSIFIRVAGCPLRCSFCDTPYAQNVSDGTPTPLSEIVEKACFDAQHPVYPPFREGLLPEQLPQPADKVRHIVVTGGEPMMFPQLVPLTEKLHEKGFHITIETSGIFFQPVACDLLSLSPKLSHSGITPPENSTTLRRLAESYPYQIKLVVDVPDDLVEVERFLQAHPFLAEEKVLLMPQGKNRESVRAKRVWLEQSRWKITPRAHLEWFASPRGV